MDYERWGQALNESMSLLLQKVSGYLPNVLGAIALLIGGWILARILRFACARLISGLDNLLRRHGMERLLIRVGLERPASDLIGSIVYWLVFLVFFAAATETLGLPVVATWLGGVSTYLPRLLIAGLILLAGVLAGSIARDALATAATAAGIAYGALLGRLVYVSILLIAIITGIDQIGIESRFLTATITIVIASAVGAAALAFGLGARTSVSNIIASHYLRQIYRVGHNIRIGEAQGRISEITNSFVIVENANDRLVVPAKEFSERISALQRQEP
ncbi:MAG: mechanosensitive ion channel [Deltaproteobacteria bacterium]|nr:mechanosensitive ion channel [Deltaproteobacteria bacterium]